MTETAIFESVTNGGSSDFALLVQILQNHGRWCLVDGLAVNCYVEPVFTIDADIVVAASELAALRTELTAGGFEVKDHEHPVNAQMKDSDLRIQFTLDQRYQEFLTDTELHTVLGETVRVASLENIVRGKVWAWSDPTRRLSKRKKDELDLIRIAEKYPAVRRLMPAAITAQLESSRKEYLWQPLSEKNRLLKVEAFSSKSAFHPKSSRPKISTKSTA